MTIQTHEITVVADREKIPGWKDYTISQDMLQPADGFSMRVQFTQEAWALLTSDPEISVFIDTTPVLTGFIDTIEKTSDPGGGTHIEVTGRDKGGRLIDESAPLFSYGGLRIKDLAEQIVGLNQGDPDPIFDRVVLTNTRNRSLLRSVQARKARVVREPLLDSVAGAFRPIARPVGITIPEVTTGPATTRRIPRPPAIDPGIFRGRATQKKIPPGTSRWAALEEFLREARLIAWSTGDGRELFVGLPNYDQESQWFFYEAAGNSLNRDETNCAIRVRLSTAEIYSEITAVGAAKSGRNYGRNVVKNRATVYDNPENADGGGTGIKFRRRKSLIVTDDGIRSAREALERAEREQLEREATHIEVEVAAPGHSQLYSGEAPAIFAVDTMAHVIDEDTGIRGDFLVTRCEFTQSRDAGTNTTMTLVPRGTLLQL